ncbi:hypothetical protein [Gordonia sp. NB41Y]|uniref:hypothetical protein n=1 Tax=Gordonia sp. NB41Y TaxID=875808 RepID=UPI0006B18803|nr:hypothetical protein [Gordonia sp. NB41Y]WLP91311.1 hypothetical protein Q9K23_03305 [Gordonia sp. NB41Y]
MQTISRTKVDQTKAYIWTKDGLPYHYGGSGNPGGDCSWFACAGAASLLGLKVNQRYGSTENFNRPGQYGATATAPAAVLGMVHAKSKSEVPAAAVLKMGFLHGGGGENSHVSSTIDGLNFESRGLYRGRSGHVVADSARAWNDSLFGDWWYLPFTVGPVDPNAFPLPDGYVYGWATGPDWMISCRFGESSDWQAGLRRIQIALGVPASGVYDELTAAATKTVQARTPGLLPDGFIGPKTWAAILAPRPEIDVVAARDTWLGKRITQGEGRCEDGVGRYAHFERGSVYWHPDLPKNSLGVRAYSVPRGGLFEAYEARGWEQSVGDLGYPVRDFTRLSDTDGVQAFQRGILYVRGGGDPRGVVVHGKIGARWAAEGFEAGPSGHALADESDYDGGQVQHFEHNSYAWHPSGAVKI